METAGTETTKKGKDVRGRKDQGQESVKRPKVIAEAIEELVELHIKAGAAADRLADAVKATAQKSGFLASVVRSFVVARAGEKFEEAKTKAGQLNLIFEKVGEA